MVRIKAQEWLKSHEAKTLYDSISTNSEALTALEEYFRGSFKEPRMLEKIAEYFILDYLEVGKSNGNALRISYASAITRCSVDDLELNSSDRISNAHKIRKTCPIAFQFMVTLAKKHSNLCQEVLKSTFDTDEIELSRGVNHPNKKFAIESWTYDDTCASNFGPVTLRARVPLNLVVSLRTDESEIVVLRALIDPSTVSIR